GDDRRVQALLRLHPRRDREGHRQRQRHHANDRSGGDVARPVARPQQAGTPGLKQGDHAPSSPFRRTPRPPVGLELPSPISSTPAPSSAATTLVSEPMTPRTSP